MNIIIISGQRAQSFFTLLVLGLGPEPALIKKTYHFMFYLMEQTLMNIKSILQISSMEGWGLTSFKITRYQYYEDF
jgi:hypothetical protein